jgi:hypothetical protein
MYMENEQTPTAGTSAYREDGLRLRRTHERGYAAVMVRVNGPDVQDISSCLCGKVRQPVLKIQAVESIAAYVWI